MTLSPGQQTNQASNWWASLKHGGMLITPAKLGEFFVSETLKPLPYYSENRLRQDVTRIQNGEASHLGALLDTVLESLLGLEEAEWQKGPAVERAWARQAMTRELIKPRRVWQDTFGNTLPVFVVDKEKGGAVARLGIGRGRRAVSRVLEWLRKADQKVALLTNGRHWRLIHAGADYDAWCEWDIDFWFEEGQPSAQVLALRLLLGRAALSTAQAGETSPLLAAIQASRQGQAELSDVLGERVRKAVELLIRESAEALTTVSGCAAEGKGASNRQIYIASTRLVMRCVVILFAEARDLLPRENAIYHNSYGLQGLREQLDRASGGRGMERLRNRFGAWPRLLALFRLMYQGSGHEALPVPRYGGGLFMPGDGESADPILRALAAFEDSGNTLSDAVVYRVLELLCRSKVKVQQGRKKTWVEAPVDFSDLSSEYIGILYEGLLDFELRMAADDDPMIFLNLGDQPVLPLTRLEGMEDKQLEKLVEKLKKSTKASAGDEDEDAEEEVAEATEAECEAEGEEVDAEETEEDLEADLTRDLQGRALEWAVRAVKAGKLIKKTTSKKADKIAEYEAKVQKEANRLIARIVLPGEWFLVRWGGTRKGSGTFYTRPQLAGPTVQRTLLPLAYDPPLKDGQPEDGERDEAAPMAEWMPKEPGAILALKVCDPACGSASFLIASLRFLVDGLWRSLFAHDWLREESDGIRVVIPESAWPSWFADCVRDLPVTLENAETYSKQRLKRFVVERCLYGVDINPLGVELGRLALWVETMDRSLPFGFLDHKVKCGNALVGCWFDQFQDYPVMAWEREGGDANHEKFVHHSRTYEVTRGKNKGEVRQLGDLWTQAIKDFRASQLKTEMKELLSGVQLETEEDREIKEPEQTYEEAQLVVERIHQTVLAPTQQSTVYAEAFQGDEDFRQLKWKFDCWCAVWFWPGTGLGKKHLEHAPTPLRCEDPSEELRNSVNELAQKYRFFHWEIEFPDVFSGSNPGFDGIVGNPPWEIQKPNSKEFFSNIDPLYRTYGKQEALDYQKKYFENDPVTEENWLTYNAGLKALSNWCKYVGSPFGDEEERGSKFSFSRKEKENKTLKYEWRMKRATRKSYADKRHPFRHQGSADINTYKLFMELGHILLRQGGRFSLIVPSGLYTDKGTGDLRQLFLNECEWTHLYSFQNERFIFSAIDHRNKMVIPSITKGGKTEAIATRFRLGPGDSPEAQELMADIPDTKRYLSVSVEQIKRFSPNTGALLEIRTEKDLEILEKMYANSVLLGDHSPQGWGIRYATEFHMTSDSKLFPPRPKWEAKGYKADEYGHWLKGNWQPYNDESFVLNRTEGMILSADVTEAIQVDDVEDVALPLYQGIMIHQFDSSFKGWIRGTGAQAVWEEISSEHKFFLPQYLTSLKNYQSSPKVNRNWKTAYRRIARTTDTRTWIGSLISDLPAGDSIFYLISDPSKPRKSLALVSILNSFVYDWQLRSRLGGTNLSWFVLEETCSPSHDICSKYNLDLLALKLIGIMSRNAVEWLTQTKEYPPLINQVWHRQLALSVHERLRIRSILEAIVAELYKLDYQDFSQILQGCDYPSKQVSDKTFARTLDPKGFWRVDKDKDPELRHTVLSLIAFHDLKRLGLDAFLNQNNGEGWMLPETLRLADYGLGHEERAHQNQPVAARLGPRFLPWQLEGTPEESWAECERHANNLKRLLNLHSSAPKEKNQPEKKTPPASSDNSAQLDLIEPAEKQLGLFNS